MEDAHKNQSDQRRMCGLGGFRVSPTLSPLRLVGGAASPSGAGPGHSADLLSPGVQAGGPARIGLCGSLKVRAIAAPRRSLPKMLLTLWKLLTLWSLRMFVLWNPKNLRPNARTKLLQNRRSPFCA